MAREGLDKSVTAVDENVVRTGVERDHVVGAEQVAEDIELRGGIEAVVRAVEAIDGCATM